MYIARREDGSIYGAWLNRQWPDQEEIAADDVELLAFLNPEPSARTIEQKLASLGLTVEGLKEALGLE
ncbi:hypothetical protein [Reyranella sp.]|uniref:hypothetical protein n=1 Tax=Reyranella sp. TaxID=1929291 RepID=UPI0012035B2B|nr:hypothetical protein [Reyranella sp.]TAJ89741.1 MAG: hypothetical protein EPO50_05080 [Reyranella sp.]